MATQQQQILQLKASIQMLERLVRAGRATQTELTTARNQLDLLVNPLVVTPITTRPEPAEAMSGRAVDPDEYLQLQADMSREADGLQRQMAELSNQLHKVPLGVPCPELVRPILNLKERIETIWDKKRYLERNRCLPQELEPEQAPAPVDETSPQRFELAYRKRRLIDQRSKLNKKLTDPKAKPSKRTEWETELVKISYELQDIDLLIATL